MRAGREKRAARSMQVRIGDEQLAAALRTEKRVLQVEFQELGTQPYGLSPLEGHPLLPVPGTGARGDRAAEILGDEPLALEAQSGRDETAEGRMSSHGPARKEEEACRTPDDRIELLRGLECWPPKDPPVGGASANLSEETTEDSLPQDAAAGAAEPLSTGAQTAREDPAPRVVVRLCRASDVDDDGEGSHVSRCVVCGEAPMPGVRVGYCEECPRVFCAAACLPAQHTEGEKGTCPRCALDTEFAPPAPGTGPMEHLLTQLLEHDLSVPFRRRPDYVKMGPRSVNLGQMMEKLKGGKYRGRRAWGQFKEDARQIWHNCRYYHDCDDLGRPLEESIVPSAVRCALILEAMTKKFYLAHVADPLAVGNSPGTAPRDLETWDAYRERKEKANEERRIGRLAVAKTRHAKSQGRDRTAGMREKSNVGGSCGSSAASTVMTRSRQYSTTRGVPSLCSQEGNSKAGAECGGSDHAGRKRTEERSNRDGVRERGLRCGSTEDSRDSAPIASAKKLRATPPHHERQPDAGVVDKGLGGKTPAQHREARSWAKTDDVQHPAKEGPAAEMTLASILAKLPTGGLTAAAGAEKLYSQPRASAVAPLEKLCNLAQELYC